MLSIKDNPTPEMFSALAKARPGFRKAYKGAQNPHLRNKYADFASVVEAAEDSLSEHGLSVVQPLVVGPDGEQYVSTILGHASSGGVITSITKLHYDKDGKLNPMQAMGSAIMYARRYAFESMFAILRTDTMQEDDGEGAFPNRSNGSPPSSQAPQAQQVPAGERLFSFLREQEKTMGRDSLIHAAEQWIAKNLTKPVKITELFKPDADRCYTEAIKPLLSPQ
jgi:hypothetical protein